MPVNNSVHPSVFALDPWWARRNEKYRKEQKKVSRFMAFSNQLLMVEAERKGYHCEVLLNIRMVILAAPAAYFGFRVPAFVWDSLLNLCPMRLNDGMESGNQRRGFKV